MNESKRPRAPAICAPPPTLPSKTPTRPQLLLNSAAFDRLGALAIYLRSEKRSFKIPIHNRKRTTVNDQMTPGQQLFAIISSTTVTPYTVFTGCQATLYADLIGAFNSAGSAGGPSVTDFKNTGLRATGPLCASRSEPRSHTSYNSMISRITF